MYFLIAAALIGLSDDNPVPPDPAGVALFESKIRPVLVEHCERCHSAEAEAAGKLRGGLRLDTRDGLLAGGDSGPAVVPGDPDASYLLAVLRYDDLVQMPPKGKLPDAVVADFAAWIQRGAPDPRASDTASPAPAAIEAQAGRAHWAYQPPVVASPPAVRDSHWPLGPIDRFVLAALEARDLHPVADADRATLARRLAYDLTGLPLPPEDVAAFVADDRPDAYERLVDRLLASPHFGERWGRHWLDVARFAESLTLRGFVLPNAWRYRDLVIDTFNADRPFDAFLRDQVAGDLRPAHDLDEARRALVATTFLTLGNTNLEDQDKAQLEMDVVDEQLDTIGKAMLAQTIGCARCHDHKFDPIPAADYYALAGILANTTTLRHANVSEWIERPLPLSPERDAEIAAAERSIADLEARLQRERARTGAVAGPIAAETLPGVVVDDTSARKVGEWKPSTHTGTYIGDGYLHDDAGGKGEKTLTFQPDLPGAGEYEVRLAYSHGPSRASNVPVTILSAGGETVVHVDLRPAPPVAGRFVSLGRYRFEANGQHFVRVGTEGTVGHVTADAVVFLPADESGAPADLDDGSALRALEADLKRLRAECPTRPMSMSVVERPEVGDIRIHIRGNVHTLGDPVPRGFLSVVAPFGTPEIPVGESGRRQLADWIASAENPLTARVFANRAWLWLFGEGLVRSPDNFGTTGEAPSHPELLDWLALQFIEDGWSVKSLVRRIVLSRTYRLSTADEPRARRIDPENRLLWHRERRRVDAEFLRDAMLAAAGRLDLTMGGAGFPPSLKADYGFDHADDRRAVYLPVFRNALPDLFHVFDFPDPSLVVGRRDSSTVAPQALFLLNHPFAIEQARAAARRLLAEPGLDVEARVELAYQRTLGRSPTPEERDLARAFVASSDSPEDAWAMLCQALFASVDFRYVD